MNVGLDLSQVLGLGLDQGLVPVWFGLVFDLILCLGLGLSLVLDLRLRPRQSMSLGLETYSVCVWLFFLSSVEFSYLIEAECQTLPFDSLLTLQS